MRLVAIQGEAGSFHHAAAVNWYGSGVAIVPCGTFKDVFVALDNGLADAAIVAIENSLYGSINEVYDHLLAHGYPIVGEVLERIHQCLIGLPGASLGGITHVHSHPVALSQCSDFLQEQLPLAQLEENYDTAASVELIKELGHKNHAAIAGKMAAERHGMAIIQSNIHNHNANMTRFLVLEKTASVTNSNKASLVLETSHKPGALYEALGVFNNAKVNLTKLQSRPITGRLWRYMFYIDIEASATQVAECVQALELLDCTVTVLGQYARANTNDV